MVKTFVALPLVLVLLVPPFILGEPRHGTIPLRFNPFAPPLPSFYQISPDVRNSLLNTSIVSIRSELLLKNTLFSTNHSTTCEQDLGILIAAASQRELWALKVFDAWGKPLPSGILKGTIFWIGNYDECIDPLYQENNRSFVRQPIETQYCALQSHPSQPVEVRTGLILGLCLPASCTRQSIIALLEEVFNVTNLTKANLHCSNDRSNEQNSHLRGTIAFIIVVSLLALIVLIGTIIDLSVHTYYKVKKNYSSSHYECHDLSNEISNKDASFTLVNQSLKLLTKKMPFIAFLAEFSAIRTLQRIFTINKTENKNTFTCLNGIRVLSLFWVILGHSFSSGIYYAWNILDMQTARRNIIFHLITSGAFAVDTFFLISGFLTAVLFVRQVKQKQLSLQLMASYYIHRYLRLTPSFILVMFVSIYLTPYFGRGPLYPIQQGFEPDTCRNGNWWTSFLYIGNFLKSDDLCLGITWYLYNDMQFHWIAPLALIPFVRGRKTIGYIITILFVLASIGSILGLLLYYPSLIKQDTDLSNNATEPVFFDKVYMAPWCRIAPYAIGLLTGFIIINTGRNYRLNRTIQIIGNILAVVLALTCVFSNYGEYILPSGLSRTSRIAYESLTRPAWSMCIAWLIFLCSTNQCAFVNRILSFSLWSPLARLNYAAYLIHIIVIFITVFNQSNPLYYQFITCVNNYVSQLFFSYLAATLVVIFFETPFFILEKKCFKQ